MVMFTQSDHPIVLKFYQYQYVTMLFNSIDQDLNMNFIKSSGLGTIYYVRPGLTNFDKTLTVPFSKSNRLVVIDLRI